MADTIAELVAKITVDSAGLKSGLSKASQAMQKFKTAGKVLTGVGAGITGSFAAVTMKWAEAGDEVQKMALRTGFGTEALSELRHAAQLSGAELTDLEKASRTLSGAIIDAGEGMTTYVRALERIGLTYDELAGLTPEDQFMKVMEALAEVEDETTKAATAADLFGRSGTRLLPLLSSGADGLDRMRQEAHDLGIVFDQEAANKAAAFQDSLTKLKGAVAGVGAGIAETLAPIITDLAGKIIEIVGKIKDWMQAHPGLAKTITIVVGVVGGLMAVLGPLLIMLPMIASAFSALLGPIGLVIAAVVGVATVVGLIIANWSKIVDFFKNLWEKIVGFFKENWDKILAILFPPIGIAVLIARNWDKIVDFFKDLWAKVTDVFKGWVENIKDFFSKLNPWNWIKEKWEELRQGIKGILGKIFGHSDVEEWTAGLKNYLKNIDLTAEGESMFTTFGNGVKTSLDEIASSIVTRLTGLKQKIAATEHGTAAWLEAVLSFHRTRRDIAMEIAERTGVTITEALRGLQGSYQFGGTIPGPIGKPQLVMAHGGETILPIERELAEQKVNIFVELDGRTIAKVVGQPLVEEIRLKTGIK